MRVLLSIRPEFVEKIFGGEKKFEFRRRIFARPDVSDAVVYSTMPVKQIVGEFHIVDILQASPGQLWKATTHAAGISRAHFNRYFEGCDVGYALKIGKTTEYAVPIEPGEYFSRFVAPQSYRYFSTIEAQRLKRATNGTR